MDWNHVCIESICSIDNQSIRWTINKSVKDFEEEEELFQVLFGGFRIGYSIPMFSGFIIMILSTLSK